MENGGPFAPFHPMVFINGGIDEEGFKQLSNLVSRQAKTGASKLDFFAAQACQALIQGGDFSDDDKKLSAKAFSIGQAMLAMSMAVDGEVVSTRQQLGALQEERKGLITENHDLKEKLKRFSKSGEVTLREVKREPDQAEND